MLASCGKEKLVLLCKFVLRKTRCIQNTYKIQCKSSLGVPLQLHLMVVRLATMVVMVMMVVMIVMVMVMMAVMMSIKQTQLAKGPIIPENGSYSRQASPSAPYPSCPPNQGCSLHWGRVTQQNPLLTFPSHEAFPLPGWAVGDISYKEEFIFFRKAVGHMN